MGITLTETAVKSILTRTSGYLKTVSSHSLQPYRGCTFGHSLCGVGCYVQHNPFLTRRAPWGSFLEARVNAAEVYQKQYAQEQRWARRARGCFSIFLSSSTDPFVPQETHYQLTLQLLRMMLSHPPDALILQTHTHRVTQYLELYRELNNICAFRVHLSIESDRDRLPGLPPAASSVAQRFAAATKLKEAGIRVVITVSPLLPIRHPREFFAAIEKTADAVVIDHFRKGDGTSDGTRTLRTPLPAAMEAVDPYSLSLAYRDQMVALAQQIMPGRVGVNIDGFAGRFLSGK